MIQLNLLPSVKLEYVKTQRTKHLLTLISTVVSLVSIGVLLVAIVTVDVVQKQIINTDNDHITRYTAQLKGVPHLDQILTVQNQLDTLSKLQAQDPVTSRLFSYISELTPSQANLDQLSIDFTANNLTIGGTTPGLSVVSNYTDTLKAATYSVSGVSGSKGAFSDVVLSSFGSGQQGATFTITCNFDPTLFNVSDNVTLTVPQSANTSQSNIFGEEN